MEGGLTSGWHIMRGGTTYGPYQWTDLVAFSRDGRLSPSDQVWQPQLPGWTPASQLQGLFPGYPGMNTTGAPVRSGPPALAYVQAGRASSHRRRWGLLSGLAVLVIAGVVVGVLFGTGVFSKQSLAVETPMQGPTVIDVPYESSEQVVSAAEGGQLEFQGAQISVPPGAVASDTTLEVKILQDDFNVSQTVSPDAEVFAVGSVVDFGPAGTVFDVPVTVTVPYDESLLPAGIPEEDVALVYWDGSAWVTVQGTVDTNKNTVTAELREFDGVALTVAAGALMVSVLGYLSSKVYKLWKGDAITQGIADTYINPDNSTVKQMAQTATCGGVSLTNKQALAQYMESLTLPTPQKLAFIKDGTKIEMIEGEHYDAGAGTNWQMPKDFFDKNMKGDCTDVTNAMVSVFRSLGYEARGVFGYETDPTTNEKGAHAWGEVLIGGKVYLIDEQGQVSPRESAMELQHLTRPDPTDRRYKMWDNVNHMQKQDPDWYKQYLTSTTTSASTSTTAGGSINGAWTGTETITNSIGVQTQAQQVRVTFDIGPDNVERVHVTGGKYAGESIASLDHGASDPDDYLLVTVSLTEAVQLKGDFNAGDNAMTLNWGGETGMVTWELKRAP